MSFSYVIFLTRPTLIYQGVRVSPSLTQRDHGNSKDPQIIEIVNYLKHNKVHMLPYKFLSKYLDLTIEVFYDTINKFAYVIIAGHKVYFPNEFTEDEIISTVRNALMEQEEPLSPHKYLTDKFAINTGNTAVLIGASDGIFCLSIIDKFDKIILFEPDAKWKPVLQLTLKPWIDKIEIVQKYVTDRNENDQITLDYYLKSYEGCVSYIQADIEGHEISMLKGASNILAVSRDLKLSICCYHRQSDQRELVNILSTMNFNDISYSYGYMIMWMQVFCLKPYLRKGVVYASKTSSV